MTQVAFSPEVVPAAAPPARSLWRVLVFVVTLLVIATVVFVAISALGADPMTGT